MEEAPTFSESEIHRWVAVLVVPFVLGAGFFGLALALGEEWPIVPAFMLGPFVMIAGYNDPQPDLGMRTRPPRDRLPSCRSATIWARGRTVIRKEGQGWT